MQLQYDWTMNADGITRFPIQVVPGIDEIKVYVNNTATGAIVLLPNLGQIEFRVLLQSPNGTTLFEHSSTLHIAEPEAPSPIAHSGWQGNAAIGPEAIGEWILQTEGRGNARTTFDIATRRMSC